MDELGPHPDGNEGPPMDATTMPIFGFYHAAIVDGSCDLVAHQLELVRSVGLLERTETLFVSLVGKRKWPLIKEAPQIELSFFSEQLECFEFPALSLLYDKCQQSNCMVYYFHTKGAVLGGGNPHVTAWREYMEYFVLEKHADCIAALNDNDICGVNWCRHPWPHYSGNFWWAKSDYVRTLVNPTALNHTNRYACESWIGSNPNVRAANLCDLQFGYRESPPAQAYRRTAE